jgi:hypothetical protein
MAPFLVRLATTMQAHPLSDLAAKWRPARSWRDWLGLKRTLPEQSIKTFLFQCITGVNDQADAKGGENESEHPTIIDGGQHQAGADADIAKVLHSLNSFPSLPFKSRTDFPEAALIAQPPFCAKTLYADLRAVYTRAVSGRALRASIQPRTHPDHLLILPLPPVRHLEKDTFSGGHAYLWGVTA